MFGKSLQHVWSRLAPLALLWLIAAAPGQAATASELLEQAIYTEETVGDLDKAIELYEKVVVSGRSAQEAAAQALLRMAQIYRKTDRPEEATKALERLVKEFPNQTDWVARARQLLASGQGLLPAPWQEGEVLRMDLKLANGMQAGTFFYEIQAERQEDVQRWRTRTRGLVMLNGVQNFSSVLFDAESFRPIESYWAHSLLGTAKAMYGDKAVEVQLPETGTTRSIAIQGPVYDNEQAAHLFRCLPLEVGYSTSLPLFSSLGAGLVEVQVDVPTKETVEVPAGTFECFKLVLNIGQEFWVSADEHRYLVRFAAGGVTAELAEIAQREADQPVPVQGDAYALQLPAGWYAFPVKEPNGLTTVYILDPRGEGAIEMTVGRKDSLPAEQQRSARRWTEAWLEKLREAHPDLAVAGQGIQEEEIAGHPAASVSAEFTPASKEDKTGTYGVAVLGGMHAVTLRATVPLDQLPTFREAADRIAKTLQIQ